MPYYALSISSDVVQDNSGLELAIPGPKERVFETKIEALEAFKANKNLTPRLKVFESYSEALDYASYLDQSAFKDGAESGNKEATSVNGAKAPVPSEGCPFKSLTPQELAKLKVAIQQGDLRTFDDLVESNPRYLITPCDTPSILRSGTRSNALHFAAESKSARVTQKVLDSLLDPDLMERMYPSESAEARTTRYLLIMYIMLRSWV